MLIIRAEEDRGGKGWSRIEWAGELTPCSRDQPLYPGIKTKARPYEGIKITSLTLEISTF